VVPVLVPGLSQTVATPHNGSARKAADMRGNWQVQMLINSAQIGVICAAARS